MMANPGLQRLLQYGLTEYEGRTYLALLATGPARARELANVSRVPRTKIYGVLDDLEAKGLVLGLPDRPKRYEAVPVDAYLARFEDDIRARLDRLRDDRTAMAQEFQRGPAPERRAGGFNVVKGRRNVALRVLEMIGRAEGEALLAGSAFLPVRLARHLPELELAAKRGVAVRVVCPLDGRNAAAVAQLRGLVEVRASALPSAGSGTLVVDARESLMTHFVPDDEDPVKGEDVGIWSDDAAIVSDMARTLRQQWDAGGEPGEGGAA